MVRFNLNQYINGKYERAFWSEKTDRLEYMKYCFAFVAGIMMISYLFYRNFIAVLFMLPLAYPYIKFLDYLMRRKKREKYLKEMREFLYLFSGELSTGKSPENSVINVLKRMEEEYPKDAYIVRDLKMIVNTLKVRVSLEQAFISLSRKRNTDHLILFSEVMKVGRRSGGDLRELVRRTVDVITKELDRQEKVKGILSEKRLEQIIMSFMPIGILGYVLLTNPEYLAQMYESTFGIIFMTCCLVVYLIIVFLSIAILEGGVTNAINEVFR